MKIEIENLGPIRKFSFDLEKDLYLIFGKNNIGKSYAVQVIYIILKKFLDNNYINQSISENYKLSLTNIYEIAPFRKMCNKLIEKIQVSLPNEVEVTSEVTEIFNEFLNYSLISEINNSFLNSFDSIVNLNNKFSKEDLKIKILFKQYFEFSFGYTQKGQLKVINSEFREKIFADYSEEIQKNGIKVKSYSLMVKN